MSAAPVIQSSSVVLVSGGARGITAACVRRLAERFHCKFILLGRTAIDQPLPEWGRTLMDEASLKRKIMEDLQAHAEKPTPGRIQAVYKRIRSVREVEDTLQAVRQAGGQAEYVSVDITDARAMQEKLQGPVGRLGPITGIIHGAGNLADKLIERKSEQDFETVYAPKVVGLNNMVACVPLKQLNFLVLFSSIVGFYGNVGQADYAMANETLNKTAYLVKRRNPDCRVVSINWGPWEAGMVTPELKRAFAERNVAMISLEEGANLLVRELAAGQDEPIQVVVGAPPLLPAEPGDGELRSYHIRRKLSLEANPFLHDHVIGDHPVLPATCAATWVANNCEQLYPGYQFVWLQNYRVLKGIVFDETLAEEYTLDLKEISKIPGTEVVFDALISSKRKNGRTLYHYSLQVKLARHVPLPEPVDLPVKLSDDGDAIPGLSLYQNGTLFHGPSFQGVERVLHVSPGKLVVQCLLPSLPEKIQGQFPVQTSNPYIYDAIVQCLLIWSQHFYQAPCLPSSAKKLEQYRAIPFGESCIVSMTMKSQTDTAVVADLLVQDMQGRPYVRIEALEGTVSRHLSRLIGRHA